MKYYLTQFTKHVNMNYRFFIDKREYYILLNNENVIIKEFENDKENN